MSEDRDPQAEARFKRAEARMLARSADLEGPSLAERLAALPEASRAAVLGRLSTLDRARALHTWRFWARPKQLAPCERHRIWFLCGGRGSGKSRAAAERVWERIQAGAVAIALIGPTLKEIKRYMLGGVFGKKRNGSGLLDVVPPAEAAFMAEHWNKNDGEIRTSSGAVIYVVTAEDAEYRGGNVDTVWWDEPCKVPPARRATLWENIEYSLRSPDSGLPVEMIVSSTPNESRFFKDLVSDPDCITTFFSSDENAANNDPDYIPRLERRFGRSRRAQQERFGRILGETEGALFSQATIDDTRRAPPKLTAIAVACDPAIRTNKRNDSTDIVPVSIDELDELDALSHWSKRAKPHEWGMMLILLAAALEPLCPDGKLTIVGEVNRGGDTVQSTVEMMGKELRREAREKKLTTERVRLALDRVPLPAGALDPRRIVEALADAIGPPRFVETHAYRSKETRAGELSVEHQNGRLHFPEVPLVELEDEITTWSPKPNVPSPNGLDAMVWGAWHLRGGFREVVPVDRAAQARAMLAAQTRIPNRSERRIL